MDLLAASPLGLGMMRLPSAAGSRFRRVLEFIAKSPSLREFLPSGPTKIGGVTRATSGSKEIARRAMKSPHRREGLGTAEHIPQVIKSDEEIFKSMAKAVGEELSPKELELARMGLRKQTVDYYRKLLSEEDLTGTETEKLIEEILTRMFGN